MTSTMRLATCLAGATLLTTVHLAGTAGVAGADKPFGDCTKTYDLVSVDDLRKRFGERADFQALFDSIDKNNDDEVCAKETPGLYNTVDNVANTGARE